MTPRPPIAQRIPHVRELHGERFVDDYFWMRQRADARVIAYLNEENSYADAVLAPLRALADAIFQETVARVKEDDEEIPYREGDWLYFARTQAGKQYRIRYRRPAHEPGDDRIILDDNQLAAGHEFFAVSGIRPSDDGKLLLYSTNIEGGIDWTMRVRDLERNADAPDTVEDFRGGEWASDNRTIYYLAQDEAKRSHRLYRHRLGKHPDELLHEESDRSYMLDIDRTRSGRFIIVMAAATDSTELLLLSADDPLASVRILLPRRGDVEYYADHRNEHFYLRINDTGPNFRVVRFPISGAPPEQWEEIVPHDPLVVIDDIELFENHCVIWERRDGLPQVRVIDLRTMQSHPIEFPDVVYDVSSENNRVFETATLRIRYESLATPESIYDYDMDARRLTLLKRRDVKDEFDSTLYQTERTFAHASDGTRIPISLVYRKDRRIPGPQPLVMFGYGAYGHSEALDFDVSVISLLDRGVIFAAAHVRGGGEYGKTWHVGGRMMQKRNSFTDFIACAEHLIASGYTSAERLGAAGASAGGLLVAAAANMRPDLFKALVLRVPFVDMINTMLDESLPLTTLEYTEWGNPNIPGEYAYIRSYSPYENFRTGAYPATYIRSGLHDSQVMYWEQAKFVARLRALKTTDTPLLLRTDLGAGHGGASGRYDKWREAAEYFAFLLGQLQPME